MSQDADTLALETLGASINRASGVLSAAGELFSNTSNQFHGGNAFAAHAITTAHTLLAEANAALAALYDTSSARAEQDAAAAAERMALVEALETERARVESLSEQQLADDMETMAESDLEATEDSEVLTWKGTPGDQTEFHPNPTADEFAKSYEELLRKVTAFEVFARQQDADGTNEQLELLPMVESLKEDLIRLSRVA